MLDVHGHPSSRHNMSGGVRIFSGGGEGNNLMISAYVNYSFSLIEKEKHRAGQSTVKGAVCFEVGVDETGVAKHKLVLRFIEIVHICQ